MKLKMISAMIAAAMALSASVLPVCAAETGSIDLIIGSVEADPGEEVTVSVTVENDTNGINSYILDLAVEGGITAVSAENGTAYESLELVSNLEELVFAGTNYTVAENIRASENGAVVFSVTFRIPVDAVPGTYDLTFEDTIIYDMNMQEVAHTHTIGSITVLGASSGVNLGDVDEDGDADATDAAHILVASAVVGAGGESGLTAQQEKNADVDQNGSFDSMDAAYVLQYAAAAGAGYSGTIEDFMASLA